MVPSAADGAHAWLSLPVEVVIDRLRCATVGTLKAAVQQLRNEAVMRDIEAGARPTS